MYIYVYIFLHARFHFAHRRITNGVTAEWIHKRRVNRSSRGIWWVGCCWLWHKGFRIFLPHIHRALLRICGDVGRMRCERFGWFSPGIYMASAFGWWWGQDFPQRKSDLLCANILSFADDDRKRARRCSFFLLLLLNNMLWDLVYGFFYVKLKLLWNLCVYKKCKKKLILCISVRELPPKPHVTFHLWIASHLIGHMRNLFGCLYSVRANKCTFVVASARLIGRSNTEVRIS